MVQVIEASGLRLAAREVGARQHFNERLVARERFAARRRWEQATSVTPRVQDCKRREQHETAEDSDVSEAERQPTGDDRIRDSWERWPQREREEVAGGSAQDDSSEQGDRSRAGQSDCGAPPQGQRCPREDVARRTVMAEDDPALLGDRLLLVEQVERGDDRGGTKEHGQRAGHVTTLYARTVPNASKARPATRSTTRRNRSPT